MTTTQQRRLSVSDRGSVRRPSAPVSIETDPDSFGQFLRMTAHALEGAASAAVTQDAHRARSVRRTIRLRRAAHDAAEQHIRRSSCTRAKGSLTHALAALQCLDDVQRVGRLADQLALQVCRAREHTPLEDANRDALLVVQVAAVQRLRCLADGLHVPAMDPGYVRCGCDLREALDQLPADATEQTSVSVCVEVARAVLAASRHAGRVA